MSDEVRQQHAADRCPGGHVPLPAPRPTPACETVSGAPVGHDGPVGDDTPLAGHAWLLRDVTHVPGILRLEGGRLRFVSTLRTVLDAAPAELGLVLPRTRRGPFGLTLDGVRVGLAVVRPSGAVPVPAEVVAREGGTHPTTGDRAAADRWLAALAPTVGARSSWPVARMLFRLAPVRGLRAPTSELV